MNDLIDTNLLVRAVDRSYPLCQTARITFKKLMGDHHPLCIVPQITAEFWVACTRSKEKNGLGYTPSRVQRYITRFESVFLVLIETEDAYRQWKRLVSAHSVKGNQAHDTRIVAAMVTHGIENIVTFNVDDFTAYDSIRVIHPRQI